MRFLSERCSPDGEVLVHVERIDLAVLKVSLRCRWVITFSDGRTGYVRTEPEVQWFRWHQQRGMPVAVTLEDQTGYVFGLPPIVVEAASFEEDDGPEPF